MINRSSLVRVSPEFNRVSKATKTWLEKTINTNVTQVKATEFIATLVKPTIMKPDKVIQITIVTSKGKIIKIINGGDKGNGVL